MFFQRLSIDKGVEKCTILDPESKYIYFFEIKAPVVIRDLDLIKSITVKNFDRFPNHRMAFEQNVESLFSKNLFSLCDERWREVQNMLTSAFTSSKMKSVFVMMHNCAKVRRLFYFFACRPVNLGIERHIHQIYQRRDRHVQFSITQKH